MGPEAGQSHRVTWDVQHGLQELLGHLTKSPVERAEEPLISPLVPAQIMCRPIDRAPGRGARAVGERMSVLYRRVRPFQSVGTQVECPTECGVDRERVKSRADVVHQSRQGHLTRSGAPTDGVGCFENRDVDSAGG